MIRYRPAAPLDRHVHFFWWSRRDTPQRGWEHMLPSGGVQLLFALHENTDCPHVVRAVSAENAVVGRRGARSAME